MGASSPASLENFALTGITVGLSLTLGIGVIALIPSILTTNVQSHPVVMAEAKQPALKGGEEQGVDDKYTRHANAPAKTESLPDNDPARDGPVSGKAQSKEEDKPPSMSPSPMSADDRYQGIMRSKIETERPVISNHMNGRKGWVHENLALNFYRDKCAGEGLKIAPGGAPPCTESVHKAQYDLEHAAP